MLNVLSYKLSYYYNYQLSSVLDTGCIDLKILIFCTLSVMQYELGRPRGLPNSYCIGLLAQVF